MISTIRIGAGALVTLALVAGTAAHASTMDIRQKGKEFSEQEVTISKGDSLRFVNDDTVAHNVFARVGSQKKDVGLQKPGEATEIVFDAAGKHRVRCAIHPKMKMTVVVE